MNKKIKVFLIIFFLFLVFIYLFVQNNFVEVTKYEIESEKIPTEFNNYKIIQISDYHNNRSNIIHKDIKKIIKEEKPDIVVITGDFVDSNITDVKEALNLIKNINDYSKIYYVSGNHEAVIGEYDDLINGMKKLGVTILDNEVIKLEKDNTFINLIGVKDPRFYSTTSRYTMTKTFKELDYDKNLFSVLLSHRPELFDIYVSNKVDLVLTGHAHGGQIRIPFIGGVIAPDQGFFPKYTSGLFEEKNTKMIISRGIGNSVLPFRINNRPEIVIVTLKAKDVCNIDSEC